MSSSKRILIVEDDVHIANLLRMHLRDEGYEVTHAATGDEGLALLEAQQWSALVLDLMLPGVDGLEICRRARGMARYTPIIITSARASEVHRILGLELGADDYVPKPCTPRELVARVRAILRRSSQNREPDPEMLSSGDLVMWPGKRTVLFRDSLLNLTGAEFSILEILLRNAGKPVSRGTLCAEGLGRPLTRFDRSLDVHLSSIRHKMGHYEDGRSPIQTLRGRGYQLLWT